MRTFEQYEKEIVECINENNIFTGNMIFTFYSGISRAHYFEIKLNESDYIKNALDNNKNRTKHSMLKKWFDSENPALQMGLMKLISTDEELKKLSMQHSDVNMTGKVQINIDQTDAKLGE
jgi:hypothetical protein